VSSACNSTRIRYTLQPVQVILPVASGMFSEVFACEFSLGIKGQLRQSLPALTADISQVPVRAFLYLNRTSSSHIFPLATDLSINLWDLSSGRRIKSMTGHTAPINTLSFSACTTMLISGSADWTVRCWDVKSPGGPKAKMQRPSGRVEEGVLPDGALDEKDDGKEQT
jgi:WD40 repeat protein